MIHHILSMFKINNLSKMKIGIDFNGMLTCLGLF